MSLRRKLFYAFTLAVVVALLILPSTSWLARLQLLPFTSGGNARLAFLSDSPSPESQDKSAAAAVARSGNDFALQYARAFGAGFSDDDHARALNRMEKLNEMYPANPVVISALLKMMTRDDVKIRRPEENLLSSPDRRSTKPSAKGERSDPAQVAKFIALAEVGEKQEPQNAYFAVMAAWGYFAAEKDTEAVAAWIRAGEKPRWEDHNTEEVQAKWNLQRAINDGSEIGAMSRMASMAGILFPQYAGMRTSARMAAVMAMQAELAGNKEAGFAIRRASRQIGQNMQMNSKSYIGNLVGAAITSIAASRAGGAESRKNPYSGNKSSERWAKERQARYVDYLRSIGHPEEATAFTAAVVHTDFLKSLFKRANARTYWGFEGRTFQLFGAWSANLLLIAGVLFCLVFAGIFKLVYKFSPRLQKSEPLQKSAKWGLSVGLLFPLIAGAVVLSTVGLWVEQDQAAMIAFGVGAICLVVPSLLLRLSGREVGHGVLVMVATWVSLAALVGAGIACMLLARGVLSMMGMFTSPSGDDSGVNVMKMVTPWALGAMVLSVPLGLLTLFGVFSRMLRVPFAAGVTRGMRAMAVPLACVLTLAWSGTLLYTLRHERAAIVEMEQMATMGEMQYLKKIDVNPSKK